MGKLKLSFTSPDVISTSPKNVLTGRIAFTVLLLIEFLKNILCLLCKLKTEFASPIANPLAPGYRTLVSLHAVIAGSGTYELLTVPSFLCHKYISIHFRIIQLWEPFKENQLTRSVESWQNLVTKLRQLLLVSFNRHLGKFEDQVRALREKRTEPRWSFTTYFSLHVS